MIAYIRSGPVWTQQAVIYPTGAHLGDLFGSSIALDGNVALIGAPWDDVGELENAGSAYVFERNGSNWTEQDRLFHPGGLSDDNFGSSVALQNDVAVVGAIDGDIELVLPQP